MSNDYNFVTDSENRIIELGNYMPSGHSASKIVDVGGITYGDGKSWNDNGYC